MAWKHVGDAGDIRVSADPQKGYIRITLATLSPAIGLSVRDAARLAVLLDQAIGVAKGDGIKINPTGDLGEGDL